MPYDNGHSSSTTIDSWSPVLRLPSERITAHLTPALSTGAHPTPRVTAANLHIGEREVRERATALAERMRVLSTGHSLRIWREAHRDALVELAREATGVGTGVACESLSWDLEGGVYHVSATFSAAAYTIH